jgi:hypothetical protein
MVKKILFYLLTINALVVYGIGLALFVSKWFPFGHLLVRLRECLYSFF